MKIAFRRAPRLRDRGLAGTRSAVRKLPTAATRRTASQPSDVRDGYLTERGAGMSRGAARRHRFHDTGSAWWKPRCAFVSSASRASKHRLRIVGVGGLCAPDPGQTYEPDVVDVPVPPAPDGRWNADCRTLAHAFDAFWNFGLLSMLFGNSPPSAFLDVLASGICG